jgi:hypothetical protein
MEPEHALSAAKKLREAHLNALLVVVMYEVSVPSANAKPLQLYEDHIEGKEALKDLSDEIVTTPEKSEVLVSRIENDIKELYA